ncbi:hypothetical protein [Pseudomonas mangiferae]|nr:hypothetical protein [Pseudomonas mangiferae]
MNHLKRLKTGRAWSKKGGIITTPAGPGRPWPAAALRGRGKIC